MTKEKAGTPAPSAPPKAKNKNLAERWGVWVALVGGLLAIIIAIADLPEKFLNVISAFSSEDDNRGKTTAKITQPLSGLIRDENNNPLTHVNVSLPSYNLTVTTNALGKFQFNVKDINQKSVDLMAQKTGYQTYDAYATLGNTKISFTMEKTK